MKEKQSKITKCRNKINKVGNILRIAIFDRIWYKYYKY